MVHKKSEYRLSYKWIPSEFCKQAWESGHSYRLQRRQYDLSHMPLPWESHGCDCDGIDADDDLLPVPKTRMKHNILNEVWDQDAQKQRATDSEKWYRRWEEREHHVKPHPSPVNPSEIPIRTSSPETKYQGANDAIKRDQKNSRNYVPAKLRGNDELIDDIFKKNGIISKEPNQELVRPRSLSQVNTEKGTQTFDRWRSLSPRRQKMDVTMTQPIMPQLTKPKIMPYGWASQRDVGDKRTFNIYAPTRDKSQFHSSALRAWKRKEHDVYQMPELDKYKPQYTPRIHEGGIWTTEYQQQYNEQKYSRPISAPPGKWRNMEHVYHQCSDI